MSEPHSEANGPRRDVAAPPELPPPVPVAADTPEDLLFNAEPSDDTPTIISKNVRAPVRVEEALAGVLRGRKLAHFELIEPIGVGGMAAVIRARDLQLDRFVALKILPPEMSADPETVQRFHQEARAAAKLDHENIARAFYCGEDQGLHFIAFEFVEGQNLRAILERRGRLPVSESIQYMLQVATGLAHAASRGVVHRDIKPSNIIITPTGRAKLVDMGLARNLQGDNGLTQSGVTLGTFDYISPEQAMEPRDADVRSDIYSLGCTFYHMLTGQPPVPDGTAARKLHHHQHVAPLDPRQLNPAIPDEVAAVLSRMMTKDPKDRYQSPERLVQHLLLLVQKLGAGSESPDGVLFVDVPLPNPPQTRPMLLGVAAVAGLLVLIILLGPASWSRPTTHPNAYLPLQNGGGAGAASAGPVEVDQGSEPIQASVTPRVGPAVPVRPPDAVTPVSAVVRSARELADVLEQNPDVAHILVAGDINLNDLLADGAGEAMLRAPQLSFQGRDLTIERAPELTQPPLLKLTYNPDARGGLPWAVLTLKAKKNGKISLKGLRLEVDAAEASDVDMSAVVLQSGQLTAIACAFAQTGLPGAEAGRLSSVTVQGPNGEVEQLHATLEDCYFAGGLNAISLTGAGRVQPTNCAFAPHRLALFHLYKGSTQQATELELLNCSALLAEGSAFLLDENDSCRLEVRNCIFSHPEDSPETGAPVVLIEQSGLEGSFQYRGTRNYYHNLPAFWMRPASPETAITKWAAFKQSLHVTDEKSTETTVSPWENADPLAALDEDKPQQAFRIDMDQPLLRQTDRRKVVGVEHCTWGYPYEGMLTSLDERKPPEPVVRNKIVDPTVTESSNGVYPSLAQAIGEAKPGDVILIKDTGTRPFKVDPMIRVEKPGIDLTLKPYPGHHPILTLGPVRESDAALFQLLDGQLRLEGLEFHLFPQRADFKAQTIVMLMGDGQCTFKDCTITLEESRDVPLNLATLVDPSSVMRMEPQPPRQQTPRLRIENCFVRGAGDLVAVRASRPFDLEVRESLVALRGSLLIVDANPKDLSTRPPLTLALTQVTSYLDEHLLWLRASKEEGRLNKGLVVTQVSAEDCLFASAGGRSLVYLDGMDSDEQMKRYFSWEGIKHNAYSNYPQLLEQQPMGDGSMALPPYDKTRWVAFTQEADGRFDKARFTAPPEPEGPWTQVLPGDFKLRAEPDLQDYGVAVERLPHPFNHETEELLDD